MTHREQQGLRSLFSFIAGALVVIGFLFLSAGMQQQDEKDAQHVQQVIACSQAAEMCRAAK